MTTLTLTDPEVAAVQRIVDSALRGGGVAVLHDAYMLQTKLKAAHDEQKQSTGRVVPVMDEAVKQS